MTHHLFDLNGRIALITGSSRGLGRSMARGLAEAGAAVVLNGVDEARLRQTVTEFVEAGLVAHGVAFDVTDGAAVRGAVARIEDEIGPIDVLVNNAGIQRRGPLETFPEDDWQAVIHTNLTGVFLVTQAVAQHMIPRRRGKIINISSIMSEIGRAGIAPYTASKGGVNMLTRTLATEWGRHNIQVNAIGPGYFATDMNQALIDDEAFNTFIQGRTPAGRWGDPDELIGPVVFLASAASDYVNGQILHVDGGLLASL
jgi:gluconate 5-dehydrogenase